MLASGEPLQSAEQEEDGLGVVATNGTRALLLSITWEGLGFLREALRHDGASVFGLVAIEKDIVARPGRTVLHSPTSKAAQPHATQLEARRQLRRLLRSTAQGHAQAYSKARKLVETHDAFEHVRAQTAQTAERGTSPPLAELHAAERRRLGWEDPNFLYQRQGGVHAPTWSEENEYFTRSWGLAPGLASSAAGCTADGCQVLEQAAGAFNASWAWGLDRLRFDESGPARYDDDLDALLFTGRNVHIYVLDSGIKYDHPEFAGRIGYGYNAVIGKRCFPQADGWYDLPEHNECPFGSGRMVCLWGPGGRPTDPIIRRRLNHRTWERCEDEHGHGTHVAGIAAGATKGVASQAIIHPVKVFGYSCVNCANRVFGSDVVRGFEWAADHFADLKQQDPTAKGVLVASLGSTTSAPVPSMHDAARAAAATGLFVAVSAGNDDKDACVQSPASAGA